MSRTAADDQQGELQGTIASINAVATIAAPLIMTQTFFLFTREEAFLFLPGAPFLLSAAMTVVCIGIFVAARPRGT